MPSSSRRGFVLILVLVVIALLTLAGFTFSELMFTERKAAVISGRQGQALAAAESGIQMARNFLRKDMDTQNQLGGYYDNPSLFRGVLVTEDVNPADRTRFTIVSPSLENDIAPGGVRFGLENESCRLNLNTLMVIDKANKKSSQSDDSSASPNTSSSSGSSQSESSTPKTAVDILMKLPGMTEEIANAILDWMDSDSEARQNGAEADYYSGNQPAYSPANGPLTSIEELLLVRGVTPELLFGCDQNRNYVIDSDESSTLSYSGTDNSDGSMNLGWAVYLTLYSAEKNVQSNGEARINLNQEDLQTLYDDLDDALGTQQANFIVGYRLYGAAAANAAGTSISQYTLDLDLSQQTAKVKLNSVLDLIGAKVPIPGSGDKTLLLESPFPNDPGEMSSYLPTLMDCTTVTSATAIPGRININQAPRVVLEGIPGITSDIVDQIIAQRVKDPKNADANRRYETWLLSEGIVTLDQMKALIPYITCGGDVYRLQSIGYNDDGSAAARIEAIIDATAEPVRVIFWRDISNLGRGFDLQTLGSETSY
jgi:type II secretory pathway component PulK